jgi:hypothetical protein
MRRIGDIAGETFGPEGTGYPRVDRTNFLIEVEALSFSRHFRRGVQLKGESILGGEVELAKCAQRNIGEHIVDGDVRGAPWGSVRMGGTFTFSLLEAERGTAECWVQREEDSRATGEFFISDGEVFAKPVRGQVRDNKRFRDER